MTDSSTISIFTNNMANEPLFTDQLLYSSSVIGESKTFVKGDYLIREGEIERNLYWVESVAIRVFYLTEFEEHVIRLGYNAKKYIYGMGSHQIIWNAY